MAILEVSISQASASSGGAAVEASNTQVYIVPSRVQIVRSFESKLKEVRGWARLLGSVKAISKFLAYCNLTWATVALLGAFLPNLHSRDFAFVSSLVFVEAARLASFTFIARVLVHQLFAGRGPRPWESYPTYSVQARCCSNVLQALFIIPSLAISIVGLCSLDYSLSDTRNLSKSLRIFYWSVAINSVVALVYFFFSLRALPVLNDVEEVSILPYFDTVLERAKDWGVVQADDFDFFLFAYTMLGNVFRQNVLPEVVAKKHKKLILYLYAHALGMDAMEVYLDSDDAFVRLAAVNVFGMWADTALLRNPLDVGLEVPEVILTKLADRVSLGEQGWAVAKCFGALTSTTSGARLVRNTFTSKNVSVVSSLAYIVNSNRSRSISPIRALVRIHEQYWEDNQQDVQQLQRPRPRLLGDQEHQNLVAKLKKLGDEAKPNRLRVQAAYLLLLMGEEPGRKLVGEIEIGNDNFWYKSEKTMLEVLCARYHDVPLCKFPEHTNFFRDDARPLRPPRWVTSPT